MTVESTRRKLAELKLEKVYRIDDGMFGIEERFRTLLSRYDWKFEFIGVCWNEEKDEQKRVLLEFRGPWDEGAVGATSIRIDVPGSFDGYTMTASQRRAVIQKMEEELECLTEEQKPD
jgi:hypothetical protein